MKKQRKAGHEAARKRAIISIDLRTAPGRTLVGWRRMVKTIVRIRVCRCCRLLAPVVLSDVFGRVTRHARADQRQPKRVGTRTPIPLWFGRGGCSESPRRFAEQNRFLDGDGPSLRSKRCWIPGDRLPLSLTFCPRAIFDAPGPTSTRTFLDRCIPRSSEVQQGFHPCQHRTVS